MAVIPFNATAFYAAVPSLQSKQIENLDLYWNIACLYIDNTIYGCLDVTKQDAYLNFMTAHLATLSLSIMAGDPTGVLTAASIDKISVTLQPPPAQNEFQWWMNQTPYGQMLYALLLVNSVGGWYVGGSPQHTALRGIGNGRFFR